MGNHIKTCTGMQEYLAEYELYYKETLEKLLERRDLETALYLRIAMETGIRSRDILLLDGSCIKERHVRMLSVKDRKCYCRLNGKFPRISRCTKRMMDALIRTQGRIFTRSFRHYYTRILEAWPSNEPFQSHMLRQIWLRREVVIAGLTMNFHYNKGIKRHRKQI